MIPGVLSLLHLVTLTHLALTRHVWMSDDRVRARALVQSAPLLHFIRDKSVFVVIPQMDATCSPVKLALSRVARASPA